MLETKKLKIGGECTFHPKRDNNYIKGILEDYLPENPIFKNTPFGIRLENGNFIWASLDRINLSRGI